MLVLSGSIARHSCGLPNFKMLFYIVFGVFPFVWQGLFLRVLGVCDSRCLVVTRDWLNEGLDDSLLLKVCQVKQDGSSLSTLGDFG